MGVGSSYIEYMNKNATRRQPLQPGLESRIAEAIQNVYGPGFKAQVYSGGQPGKGEGGARVGSVRHDHGKAGDIYVVDPNGKRITGDALAPLGQYWAAKEYGGVGMEMRGGGIHLDAWEKPPPGGGMTWNYANQGGRYTPAMQQAIANGLKGELPGLVNPSAIAAIPQTPTGPGASVARAAQTFLGGGGQVPVPTPAPAAGNSPVASILAQAVQGQAQQPQAPAPVANEMQGAAGIFPAAPKPQGGLIDMVKSGQPMNMETAKTFLGGNTATGVASGLGLLAQGLQGSGAKAPEIQPVQVEDHRPDMSLLAMLQPKRKRLLGNA